MFCGKSRKPRQTGIRPTANFRLNPAIRFSLMKSQTLSEPELAFARQGGFTKTTSSPSALPPSAASRIGPEDFPCAPAITLQEVLGKCSKSGRLAVPHGRPF